METIKPCTCKCGSTAIAVTYRVTVPSFDDEGWFDGEDIVTYDEIVCHNPDCDNGLTDPDEDVIPPECKTTDDLPF